ncbi:hypothetical protein A6A04_02950 [Paramagnetospirillum marisnigri]|uniref:Uncharacterized protein n=1 Tax=Paramagnetospirillum marisnigri TaxID=1285242 RepID=A0A178MK93_9PROT|nr:hypothetical protein [Paramagnetospirillum marisnigri]OAN49096.1 hypothetical protein A6A04_02950 [Paramagnetospirillum marisnigri]
MTNRFDLTVPRPGRDGKTRFVRIGTGWQNTKGFSLEFDALPIADHEGKTKVVMFPATDRSPAAETAPPTATPTASPLSDDVPIF